MSPWQVLSDCPHCRIEAAVIEWMDPAFPPCREGIPQWRRCRACGFEERADGEGALSTTRAPLDLRSAEVARAALGRWAAEEGEGDVERFCTANLGGGVDEVLVRLGRGEVVGTTFDVIAFLFPHAGAGAGGGDALPRVVDGLPPEVAAPPARAPEVAMDPHTPARFLVSVMLADGALRSGERRFVDGFLLRNEWPALRAEDLRVWRPLELGSPPPAALRDRLLEAAVHLMHLDRVRDGNEWRVVKAFASAWGLPEQRLREWDARYGRRYSSVMQRLGALVSGWVS